MYGLIHKSTDILSWNFRFRVDDEKFIQRYAEEQLNCAESSLSIYHFFILEHNLNKIYIFFKFVSVEHL